MNSVADMDDIFKALANQTRRDILERLVVRELSVTEIAEPYNLEYATISKHLKNLERANLISRRRDGKHYLIQTNLKPLKRVDNWIEFYRNFWNDAFDKMDGYLQDVKRNSGSKTTGESKNEK